jgi:hypothetical protein
MYFGREMWERDHLGDPGVDRRINETELTEKQGIKVWSG